MSTFIDIPQRESLFLKVQEQRISVPYVICPSFDELSENAWKRSSPFTHLPTQLKEHIHTFANARELCLISSVSKAWRITCQTDHLWKTLFKKDAPHALVNEQNKDWKRHYFFNRTLDYQCRQAYESGRARGAVYNVRAAKLFIVAVGLAGVVTTVIGFRQSYDRPWDLGGNPWLRVALGLQEIPFIVTPISKFYLRTRRAKDGLGGLLALGGMAMTITCIACSQVSNGAGYSLLALHSTLLIKGDEPLNIRRLENCMGSTVGAAKSWCTRVGELFQRIFCCRRRYMY